MGRYLRLVRLSSLVVLSLGLVASSAFGQGTANERVFYNAKIFTAEPENPYADAIAIRGDKIVAVGNYPDVAKSVSANAERVDVHSKTLFPGFIDSHMHAIAGGLNLISADASDNVETMDKLVAFVRDSRASGLGMEGDIDRTSTRLNSSHRR